MNDFVLENISCGYKGEPVLSDVSLSIGAGEALCLLGPNGVGKTTLFRTMLGFLKPLSGRVLLDGEDIAHWSPRKLARHIGYVPQSHTPPFAYPVIDVVTIGRLSRLGAMSSPSRVDVAFAYECLERLGVAHLANELYTQISGGERQMVLIARAMAQEPQLLVMDEPTASLDYGNQVKVLRQIASLVHDGISVVMTTHFPDHAFLCATKVGLITRSWVRIGAPDEVVTERALRETYGVDVRIVEQSECDCGRLRGCVPIVGFTLASAEKDAALRASMEEGTSGSTVAVEGEGRSDVPHTDESRRKRGRSAPFAERNDR